MKVLFLTTNDISDFNGGAMASRRNFECLQDIYGSDKVDYSLIKDVNAINMGDRILRLIRRSYNNMIYPTFSHIGLDMNKYDMIFIDRSLMGAQIYNLRKKGYKGKIVTFFHNCEYDYYKMFIQNKSSLGAKLFEHSIRINELYSIKYSDACVFINSRDKDRTEELYGKSQKAAVAVMTLHDTYNPSINKCEVDNQKPLYTILGSYFKPNVDGAMWFVKNVYPYIEIRLRIIGKNMHLLRDRVKDKQIEIISNVNDLSPYMVESDYMLYPIFEGSGMKIKTCEALMWGKNIVGTPEAFSGYGINDYSKVGACCETAAEFISAINSLDMPKFNEYSRNHYKTFFSFEKSVQVFNNLLS